MPRLHHAQSPRPMDYEALANDIQLLDESFDEAIDFHDAHAAALEIDNQFTTHMM